MITLEKVEGKLIKASFANQEEFKMTDEGIRKGKLIIRKTQMKI